MKIFFNKALIFLKLKWKWLLASIVGFFTLFLIFRKNGLSTSDVIKFDKDQLEKTIEIEEKFNENLLKKSSEINNNSFDKIKKENENYSLKIKELKEKEQEIVKEERKNDSVSKDLANILDANYVEMDKK